MLSKLTITFLPRSKHLLISWLQSPSAVILEPKKTKSDTVSTVSPSIPHGAYIRTLCTDVGEALGCGANMVELRRTRSGLLKEEDAATMQDIADAYIFWQQNGRDAWMRSIVKPIEILVDPLPKIILKATAVDAVCRGADLTVKGIHMLDEDIRRNALVAMMTARGELVGIGQMMMSAPKIMASQQGVAVRTTRVIMEPGHYPSMWKFSTDLEEDSFPQ